MPPKHVYGKRANRAALTFKSPSFLSPDKDANGQGKLNSKKDRIKKEDLETGQSKKKQMKQDEQKERRTVLSPRDGNKTRRREVDADVETLLSNLAITDADQENEEIQDTVAVDSTPNEHPRRPKKIRPGKAKAEAILQEDGAIEGLGFENSIKKQEGDQSDQTITVLIPRKKSSKRPRKLKDTGKSGDGTEENETGGEHGISIETISDEGKEVGETAVSIDVAAKSKKSSRRNKTKERKGSRAGEEQATESDKAETISKELEKLQIQESTKPLPSPPRTSSKPKPKSTNTAPIPPPTPPPEPATTTSPSPPDIYTTHISPLLPYSNTRTLTPFTTWSTQLDPLFHITKIAEASYGEVYRLSLKHQIPGFTRADESVLKLIAIKPPPNAPSPTPIRSKRGNAAAAEAEEKRKADREEKELWMSPVPAILSEVQLLSHLSPIPGFTNFRDLVILQGRPDGGFVKAWRDFNKSRPRGNKSIFPDPGLKKSYEDTQLWAVIEMQDAGMDLERWVEAGGGRSVWEVWDVFWGVGLGVGCAEGGVGFEHRDLHLGNICIRSPTPSAHVAKPRIRLRSLHQKLHFTDLEMTVIDYTLSRADMRDAYPDSASASASPSPSPSNRQQNQQHNRNTNKNEEVGEEEAKIAYQNLDADPALFQGNAADEYQYEIYRLMRSTVYFDDPTIPYNPSTSPPQPELWRQFHPRTNLLWLHFLLHKLLENMVLPSQSSVEDVVRDVEMPEGVEERKVWRKACRLEKVLKKVRRVLEPEMVRGEGLGSVRELVAMAVQEGWLRGGDVG